MQRPGAIPALRFPQKEGYPPRKKLSRIKQRIGFAHWNLKYGKEAG